jgi:hypothetical protein
MFTQEIFYAVALYYGCVLITLPFASLSSKAHKDMSTDARSMSLVKQISYFSTYVEGTGSDSATCPSLQYLQHAKLKFR